MRSAFLFSFALVLVFTSCRHIGGKRITGDGQLSSQQRTVGDFSGVEVSGPFQVYVAQGSTSSIKIEGDGNLLDYIETEREGNLLEIKTRRRYNLRPRAGIKIYVTSPSFEKLSIAGSGKLQSLSKLSSPNTIAIDVAGSGDVVISADAPAIKTGIAGSGSISLNGTTRNFSTDIAGSGDIRAFNLMSETASIEIAGSGNAQVFASKELNVEIAGSGDVSYRGNPPVVNQNTAGSGKIRKVQ